MCGDDEGRGVDTRPARDSFTPVRYHAPVARGGEGRLRPARTESVLEAISLGPAIFSILILLPVVSGCQDWGNIRPPEPETILEPTEVPLLVPISMGPGKRARFVSALPRLKVRAARSQLLVWHSLPGTSDWSSVEREGDGSSGWIDLSAVGVHLLAAAPAGSLPASASVQITVDREPPSLEVRFEKMRNSSLAGAYFRLHWRAEDPRIRARGVRLEWRDPVIGEWQAIASDLRSSGVLQVPYPAGDLASHRIRLIASDLAGNETKIEVGLGEAFDRIKWRAGADAPIGAMSDRTTSGLQRHDPTPGGPPAPTAESPTTVTPTGASPTGVIPTAAIPWPVRPGEWIAGGERLPAPVRGPVHLLAPDGTSRLLPREGNTILLPRETGFPYRLEGGGRRSPEFTLDSDAPEVRLTKAQPGRETVVLEWSVTDLAEVGGVRTLLRVEGDAGVLPTIELVASPQTVPLRPGAYRLLIEARDARGNSAHTETMAVRIGEVPPGVRDLTGETIAGGRSRYLLLDSGGANGTIELRARKIPEGEVFEIGRVDAGTRMILWEVPPIDGEFQLEIAWNGAAGEPRVRLLNPTFRIDATPPRCEVVLARADVQDTIRAELRGEPGIELIGLHRRRGNDLPWETLRDGWLAVPGGEAEGGDGLVVEVDTLSWDEGEWWVGALLRDSRGILGEEPHLFPAIRVDRTPPLLGELQLPPAHEGVPLRDVLKLEEAPATHAVTWIGPDGARSITVDLVPRGDGISIDLSGLPAGDGRLEIRVADAAGNESTVIRDLVVRPALRSPLVILPAGSAVPPGDEIFIEVPLAPDHPDTGSTDGEGSPELRLLDERGNLRAQWPLAQGRRVSIVAPRVAGNYRVEAGPRGGVPFRGGVVSFRVDPSIDPEERIRELVISVRDWEGRRHRGVPTASLEGERRALIEEIGHELELDARSERLRRAIARLHLGAVPPRRDLAAEVLNEGLRLPLGDAARAALLNDLAVLTLATDEVRAWELLRLAVKLDPTAGRHRNLGDVSLRLGRTLEATIEYAAAVTTDPSETTARERWARAAARLGPQDRESARRTLDGWIERGLVSQVDAEHLRSIVDGRSGDTW